MAMDPAEVDIEKLYAEIQSLREKLLGLRASRRVLMEIMAVQAREHQWQMRRLELENKRLRRRNLRMREMFRS